LIKIKKVNSVDNSIVVVVSDISRVKELEKIEKRVMTIFFQTITHKLNTPLN
jgi:nickel-dependent lactate racemase